MHAESMSKKVRLPPPNGGGWCFVLVTIVASDVLSCMYRNTKICRLAALLLYRSTLPYDNQRCRGPFACAIVLHSE